MLRRGRGWYGEGNRGFGGALDGGAAGGAGYNLGGLLAVGAGAERAAVGHGHSFGWVGAGAAG